MKEIDRFTANREKQTFVSCRGVSELFVCLKQTETFPFTNCDDEKEKDDDDAFSFLFRLEIK